MTTIVTKFIKRKHSKKLDGKHVMINSITTRALHEGIYVHSPEPRFFYLTNKHGNTVVFSKKEFEVEEIITTEEP